MNRRNLLVGGAVALVAAVAVGPTAWNAWKTSSLVSANIVARGGHAAWAEVEAVRFTGQMDLGQQVTVPYTLEQQVPGRMRLEFDFGGKPVIQVTDGKAGWVLQPFKGEGDPKPMSADELQAAIDTADPRGLLFDASARGHSIDYEGAVDLDGKPAHKLKVTLKSGAVRWVYLDAESKLDVALETTRDIGKKTGLVVRTTYTDWQASGARMFPRRQDTRTEGDDESHFLTIDTVQVNPELPPDHFGKPGPVVLEPEPIHPREQARLPPGTPRKR